MTEKLYYADAYLAEFTANVVSCVPDGDRFRVILDRTAFYPEGGGQRSDAGTLGGAALLDVRKDGDEVVHFVDRALSGEVECAVDFAPRYRMMQNHTAEHLASGTFHRLCGANNVGFHMGSKDVTFDLDVEPDEAAIARAEYLVNEAVFQNIEVVSSFPTAAQLAAIDYRSKKEFPEGATVRIVTIDGVDVCACGALHVRRTGEIGRVKFVSHARYKGGVRVHMLAGYDALEYDLAEHAAVTSVAERLSAKPEELSEAVALLEAKLATAREERRRLAGDYAAALVALAGGGFGSLEGGAYAGLIGGAALIVSDAMSADELRFAANLAAAKHRYGVSVGAGGNIVITAGDGGDAKAFLAALREKVALSGGGKSDMVSGRLGCTVDELALAMREIAK